MLIFGAHHWRGESGRRYRFRTVLTKAGLPRDGRGGVYVFVRRRYVFFLEPLYVGKARDLRSRLLGHEKWAKAYWYYGATERHVCGPVEEEADRRAIEEDLIRSLRPRMNDMEIPNADRTDAPSSPQLRRRGLFFGGPKLAPATRNA